MKNTLLILIFSGLIVSCSNLKEYDTSTAEGAFKQAEEYEKFERYDEAIDKFKNVKHKFPYSKLAKAADLKVADIYFKKESFVEAQASYQIYKDFYPQDDKIDFVTYRMGLSSYKQMPEVVGRDLSSAEESIEAFNELERSYPKSTYLVEATKMRTKAFTRLAEKELYVADFYFKKEKYKSALGRYKDMLDRYHNVGLNKRALYGATMSAKKAGLTEEAKALGLQLVKLFKGSAEAKKVQLDVLK